MNDDTISKPRASLEPGLHIVATPIGNLADLAPRARDALAEADLIACEDKRHTARLLSHYGITTATSAYHEHNAAKARPALLRRLARGEAIALVSDAGTPLLSDPGYKLVREAIDAGIPVTGVPGANAAVLALVLSGLPSDRYLFAGFPPPKSAARRAVLEELRPLKASLVFHESPRRLASMLEDATAVLGQRGAAVARELTKRHEEVRRGSLAELSAHYADAGPPRGEVTVVIGPPDASAQTLSEAEIDARLDALLGEMSVRDASAALTAETGLPRRVLYERALARKREGNQ